MHLAVGKNGVHIYGVGTARCAGWRPRFPNPLLPSDEMHFADNGGRRELTTPESILTCIVIIFIGAVYFRCSHSLL